MNIPRLGRRVLASLWPSDNEMRDLTRQIAGVAATVGMDFVDDALPLVS